MAEKYGTIPKDFKGRIAYFWDYYKWHTIAVLSVAVLLTVTLVQCANRPNPDYKAILCISKTVIAERADAIKEYLKKYGEDINGDGEIVIELVDVSTAASGNPQMIQAQKTKLMAEIQIGDALIYITDEEQFEYLNDEIGLFQKRDYFKSYEGKAFNWNSTAFEKAVNEDFFFPKDLFFSMRIVKNSAAEKMNKNAQSDEKNANRLMEKLVEANPVNQDSGSSGTS